MLRQALLVCITNQLKRPGGSVLKHSSLFSTKVENESKNSKATESKSFALNIFRGVISHDDIFPYKDVLTDEQKSNLQALIEPTAVFLRENNDAAKNDSMETVAPETLEGLKELGAFGLQISEEYGGLGLNSTQYGRLGEIIGSSDLALAVVLGSHQSIGLKGISLFGNVLQKEKYLPKLARGEHVAAFCLTEPGSGSDAGSIKSKAVASEDGNHFILNGSKIWISNGGIADILTVFAKTPVTDPSSGVTKDKMTAFIVERSFKGVSSGPPEKKMGIKASNTAEVYFEDVKVPMENVLGGLGEGFKVAMNVLNNGRFGMAATLTGTMKKCIQTSVEHATSRVQFGRKLETFGTIQEKIARMVIAHYVCESLAYAVAGSMDEGSNEYQVEAAISKIYGSEAAWFVVDESIQILGGNGYMKEYGLERIMRDLRIFRIFEGTNDILRLFVALTGIQYAGSHLKELQEAFKNPATNLGVLIEEGSKRAKRMVGMKTGESMAKYVHPILVDSANLATSCIEDFAIAVESLLFKYGKNVIDQQFFLNRLADSAIEIYCMAVVLSRASRSIMLDLNTSRHESMMAHVVCAEGYEKVKGHLRNLRNDASNRRKFEYLAQISKEVVSNGGIYHQNPLGF